MEISWVLDNGTIIFSLTGRLDTLTAPDLEKEIQGNCTDVEKLVFDFQELEYISSAGLRVLLSAHKLMKSKGGMVIKNVNSEIMEIFEVTGFTDILNIE